MSLCVFQETPTPQRPILDSAEVKNPIDMDAIRLALQGYNYGNGYIAWAKSNYGGYTLANAAEFSDKMAEEKGMDSYGDKQYVPHVLRYYSLGRIPSGIGNQEIVQVALTQEGNSGGLYWSWFGFESEVSWCACFVSWCADQCGYLESGILPKFSLCSDGVDWFENKGQFQDGSYVPAAGDIIFFDWGNDETIDHVGIVESVNNGTVNTIEGNSADMVKRNSYSIGDSMLYLLRCGILNKEMGEKDDVKMIQKSDLILLIEVEDELYRMDKVLEQLTGQGYGSGDFIKLNNVYDVIKHNVHPAYSGSEEADEKFHEIISNLDKTPEERARILRNGIF